MMRSDKLGDRIIGKAVNLGCYAVLCLFLGWYTIEGGTSIGSEWGYALDEFLEKMDNSSIAGATASILWLIVEFFLGAFAVSVMTALSIVGVFFLFMGWPLEDLEYKDNKEYRDINKEEAEIITRAIGYFVPPAIIIITATVATVVSIWKGVYWDMDNKEFTLTCLVSLLPIGVCVLWFGILRMIYKDINKK